jgi:hypothetical protein
MFNKWRRFAAIFAAIALPVLAALWSAILSKLPVAPAPGQPPGWQSTLPYFYVGGICFLSAFAAYLTHVKPALDLEKPVLGLLALLAAQPLKLGNQCGISPRMNVMLVQRPWYYFGRKRIRVVWSVNMEGFPDVKFKCFCDQGVSGQALKTKRPVYADCSMVDKSLFSFSQKQLDQTSHVQAVLSWPIYEVDKQGEQTGAVIGVVNLDGTATDSFNKLIAKTAAFDKCMKKFAEVTSTIV